MSSTGSRNGEPTTRAARCIPGSVHDADTLEEILTTKQEECQPDSYDIRHHAFRPTIGQCLCGRYNRPTMIEETAKTDMVNHPPHYTGHPKGIECIDVIEEARDPLLANVLKYVWRVLWGNKEGSDKLQDLKKAQWYLNRAITRLEFPRQKIETFGLAEHKEAAEKRNMDSV